MIKDIFTDENPAKTLESLLYDLLKNGPEKPDVLEKLAYYKKIYPSYFNEYEKDILYTLGLFYKTKQTDSLLSLALSVFSKQYKEDFEEQLTPIQASIRYALKHFSVISISAPTSAGKSYAIRGYLKNEKQGSVIVVPSRSLVDEYLNVMKTMFAGDKNVLVTSFIDDVFKSRDLRHIFVVTPERARELFISKRHFEIGCFFFDEAHLSEDMFRGIVFNILISKIKEQYPSSKLIFAHPFVNNPEAQVSKFSLEDHDSFSRAYNYGAVGRICVYQNPSNHKYYYFSPYEDKGHQIKKCHEFEGNFKDFIFKGKRTVLTYVSKASIYSGKYLKEYSEYIADYDTVDTPEALSIIDKVEQAIGSDDSSYVSV